MSASFSTENLPAAATPRGKAPNPRRELAPAWEWLTDRAMVWLRLGLILGVLLVSFGLGYVGTNKQLLYVLVALVGAVGFFVLTRWPGLGILGIPLTGIFVHYVGPGGFNVTMALVAGLLVIWVVDMVIFKREIRLVASGVMAPILAMMVVVTLAFVMGQFPWFPTVSSAPLDAQVGGYAVYFLSFGAFLLIANQLNEMRWLQVLTWVFVILAGVYVVGLVSPWRAVTRNLMGNMGSVFYVWVAAVAYSQALFNKDLHLGWRGLLLGVVVVSLYILFTLKFKDKSGWIPVMIVLWVITTLWSWQLGIVMLIGGIIGGLALLPQVLSSEDYSLTTRLEVLPILAQIVRINPLFGVGFANYYYYTPLFNLRGYYVSFNSHNNYADLVVQTGLVGTFVYFWLVIQVAYLGWKLRARVKGGFARAYVNGALGGGVGMIVVGFLGDWVLPFVYNIGLLGFRTSVVGWLFLGGLVVIQQIYREPSALENENNSLNRTSGGEISSR